MRLPYGRSSGSDCNVPLSRRRLPTLAPSSSLINSRCTLKRRVSTAHRSPQILLRSYRSSTRRFIFNYYYHSPRMRAVLPRRRSTIRSPSPFPSVCTAEYTTQKMRRESGLQGQCAPLSSRPHCLIGSSFITMIAFPSTASQSSPRRLRSLLLSPEVTSNIPLPSPLESSSVH